MNRNDFGPVELNIFSLCFYLEKNVKTPNQAEKLAAPKNARSMLVPWEEHGKQKALKFQASVSSHLLDAFPFVPRRQVASFGQLNIEANGD